MAKNKDNTAITMLLLPKLLRIIPALTWELIENINEKIEYDTNNLLVKEMILECQHIQLSEQVSK